MNRSNLSTYDPPTTILQLQPIPYQGSKRKIASKIMHFAPKKVRRLIEPFAGSAAITLYAAKYNYAEHYLINDSYNPLIELWKQIVEEPQKISEQYSKIWETSKFKPNDSFYRIRDEFNKDKNPVKFLYLISRCVKNAVRFNSSGNFNQSPDKRRLGRSPTKTTLQLNEASRLLRGKVTFMHVDYVDVLKLATPDDLVYMDPPYQGTSNNKDPRYHQGTDFNKLINSMKTLIDRGIPFILSFDGSCGNKSYGKMIPSELNLKKISIRAGRSSQATLNGKNEETIESLYLSPNISSLKERFYSAGLFEESSFNLNLI